MNRHDRRAANMGLGISGPNGRPSRTPVLTRDFSFGGPLWSVNAVRHPLGVPLIEALAAELTTHTGEGAWFSGHVWRGDERHSDKWQFSNAVVLDFDFCTRDGVHRAPPSGVADLAASLARAGSLWMNILYATPRGARAIYVLDRPVFKRNGYLTAFIGALELARFDLARHGLLATRDSKGRPTTGFLPNPRVGNLEQVFFTPRATVDGFRRNGQVLISRPQPHSLERLQKCASVSNARRLY